MKKRPFIDEKERRLSIVRDPPTLCALGLRSARARADATAARAADARALSPWPAHLT